MSSREDQIANRVLEELYQDITDQMSVDEVAPVFYAKHRITLSEFNRIKNLNRNFTEEERKHCFYSTALGNKGREALEVFLSILVETSVFYEPHAKLAVNLREKYERLFERDVSTGQTRQVSIDVGPPLVVLRTVSSASGKSTTFTDVNSQLMETEEVRDNRPMISKTGLVSIEECREPRSVTNPFIATVHQNTNAHDEQHINMVPLRASNTGVNGSTEKPAVEASTGFNTETATGQSEYENDNALEKHDHRLSDMTRMKLILLGNSGVGKTSIISQFARGVYSESPSRTTGGTRSTHYICHRSKKANIEMSIWDMPGQETVSHCVSSNYYHNIDVVIMVFDMTDDESRKSLHSVKDWSNQLFHCTSKNDIPIILAGNKCESVAISNRITEHALRMVEELQFDSFMKVSAKENIHVNALFEKAISLALDSQGRFMSMRGRGNVLRLSTSTAHSQERRNCCCWCT